jgi:hypothetical protein
MGSFPFYSKSILETLPIIFKKIFSPVSSSLHTQNAGRTTAKPSCLCSPPLSPLPPGKSHANSLASDLEKKHFTFKIIATFSTVKSL